MMRKRTILAAALQVLALAYMAGERELVVSMGRTIYLRTAPVDPRDVMRGDYVRLNYEISRVPQFMLRGSLSQSDSSDGKSRDRRVYAHLQESANGVAELTGLSDSPPASGLYIRGRLEPSWGGQTQVRYGLEAYFMEQGKALELEQGGARNGVQSPLEMEVAVGRNGLAVLKGYRWPALGASLELETVSLPRTNHAASRQLKGAKVRLVNTSTNDLAILDLPGARSLALADASFEVAGWVWSPPTEPPSKPKPEDVVILKPGAEHTIRVVFSDQRWTVEKGQSANANEKGKKSLAELSQDYSAQFRFEYRPPDAVQCKGLPHEALIWHGRLSTRAFNASSGQ